MVNRLRMWVLLLATPLLAVAISLQARAQASTAEMRDAGLIVGNLFFTPNDGVLRYNGLGTFIDKMVPSPDPVSGLVASCCLTFGPDENLYVSNPPGGTILRFNGLTGEFIDTFIPQGRGGLFFPLILLFHEGYLYVGDTGTGAIRRYDAHTGVYIDNFIPDNSQGMGEIFADQQHFVFGSDGNLYVAAEQSGRVLKYDGKTGTFLEEFVPASAGFHPSGLTVGPDGLLYAGNPASGEVRRYDLKTGDYEVFIPEGTTLSIPVGISFGPDGNFYATSVGHAAILKYDGKTGAYLGPLVPTGRGGLTGPRTLAWKAKTTICHSPGGNPTKSKTLTIGYFSGLDHLVHGDTLGACH